MFRFGGLRRAAGLSRFLRERLGHPFLGILVGIVLLVSVTIYFVIADVQRRIIEHEAVRIAEVVALNSLTARSVFNDEVAEKLARDGFGSHADYRERGGFVPLPAQFLKLVGERARARNDGLYSSRPISKWNIEPSQGVVDGFQRWAWAELEAQDRGDPGRPIDWRGVWRFETLDGRSTLRYLFADAASSNACVSCHNEIEASESMRQRRVAAGIEPGKRWKQHQLLGAIEVHVPVDRIEALAAGQTRATLALVLSISILGLIAAAAFAVRDLGQKQELVRRFEHQARYDGLTGLPNRAFFEERAEGAFRHAGRTRSAAAVMFVDLDNFKNINDSLGHAAGDHVLKETSRRLLEVFRKTDTVARQSGDEFAILLTDVRDMTQLASLASKVRDILRQPVAYAEEELVVSASIGIACFPQDGRDAATLLKNADAAMYRAKESGRDSSQFYSQALNVRARSKLALATHLRRALERGELDLHYQPKISLATGKVRGVEALLRWNRPGVGMIGPDRFMPVAEETGLILPLGDWVLEKALAQVREWTGRELEVGRIAVNLSVRQFRQPDLAGGILRALDRAGVTPHRLELEITESTMMGDPDRAEQTLLRLHDRGITIAVDDFGTGYSSMGYLKRFAIDALKIDKSFIDGVPADESNRAIAHAIIMLASSLRLRSIAEGVEHPAQRAFLEQEGCTEIQGFLVAPPMPAAELERFIATLSRQPQAIVAQSEALAPAWGVSG